MTWSGFLLQVHIIVNPNNVVWFSIRPTTPFNLARRNPILWMKSLHPNLTSNWHNNDNLDNDPSPNRINPSRIVCCLCLLYMSCLLFFLFVLYNARPHRIEDVENLMKSKKTGARGTGIEEGAYRQRMEASPNTHLSLFPPLYLPSLNYSPSSTSIFC